MQVVYVFKTLGHRSTTSATSEFLLNLNTRNEKNITAKNITLSVVDTPGFGDTRGLEQDARNLACNKIFMDQINGDVLPNLVMFVLRADGNRDLDDRSLFANSLDIYFDPEMGLTDETGSNVLIVLTHALSITNNDANWANEAMKKMRDVQKFVFDRKGCRPTVTILENMAEGSSRIATEGHWTILPDGKTYQPWNLFTGMMEVFDRNDDFLGKTVTEIFFKRDLSHSIVELYEGESIAASTRPGLTELEQKYFDRLAKDLLQASVR